MSPEKLEELKLKQKFPQAAMKGGQSQFLMKRLQQRVSKVSWEEYYSKPSHQ